MNLITISEVSKTFRVSTRTLRYYEKLGLLTSQRTEGYAYRMYDENAVRRLQYILILRKLRIPLKQIAMIMNEPEQISIIEALEKNLNEIKDEITSLETIRDILSLFILRLKESTGLVTNLHLFHDSSIIGLVETLSLSRIKFKENRSMDELNKATETINKLNRVRIVLLPPCTVASYHFIGENPEETIGEVMDQFIRKSNLYEIKPDARMFGFNHPNPSPDKPYHGYENWLTIPDDMEVPAPLVKKRMSGGMYAAHTIQFPDFHEWELLIQWANENEKYVPNYSEQGEEIMQGCLEEYLNLVYASHMGWPENGIDGHIDLLLPVTLK